jgi:tripartite-type tricarboxylate transporter receptor subunit TctC
VPDIPNVPTLTELGYPDIVATTWFSLSGPAGLPKEIVDKINHTIVESLNSEKVTKRLSEEEVHVKPMTPAEVTEFIHAEQEKWRPVLAAIVKNN